MIRLLCLIVSLHAPFVLAEITSPSSAEYADISALMESHSSLQGRFDQVKYLAALEAEISSSGRFEYEHDKAIRWHTRDPIENLLTLTPRGILSEQDGKVLSRLDAQSNPVVSLFSDIFFGVMTADWQRLEHHFEMESRVTGADWHAILTPRAPEVESIVSRVELQGDRYLREIILHEAGGDWTRIRFSELPQ